MIATVKDVLNGSAAENGLKNKEWKRVESNYNAKSTKQMTSSQIQSHMSALKKNLTYHAITMNSGFGFDQTTGLYTASNEVWDEYIRSHKDAKPYRLKP